MFRSIHLTNTLLFSSERIVDDSINIALKTRENLRRDRGTFKAIHSQMTTLASEFLLLDFDLTFFNPNNFDLIFLFRSLSTHQQLDP